MTDFLTFKDKPLVRSKNVIYYGDMADKFVIKLEILTSHKENDVEVADKIKVMLIKNNAEHTDDIVKSTEKTGMYEAMNFATTWLERALAGK